MTDENVAVALEYGKKPRIYTPKDLAERIEAEDLLVIGNPKIISECKDLVISVVDMALSPEDNMRRHLMLLMAADICFRHGAVELMSAGSGMTLSRARDALDREFHSAISCPDLDKLFDSPETCGQAAKAEARKHIDCSCCAPEPRLNVN